MRPPGQATRGSDMKCTCIKRVGVSGQVTTPFLVVNHNDVALIFTDCMCIKVALILVILN